MAVEFDLLGQQGLARLAVLGAPFGWRARFLRAIAVAGCRAEPSAMTLSPSSNPFNWPPALGFRLDRCRARYADARYADCRINDPLLGFVEFQRQSIRVAEEGEAPIRIWVDPDWLNGNAGGFQAHNYGVEVHHGECQVPQPCRLWIRRPRHWGREGEQFQLGESDPQVGLPRLPLLR